MKKTQIAPDFKVTDRMIELAKENGWPLPDKEVAGFIDYHLAHGSTMADWEAAFRTWLRNAAKWNKNGNGAVHVRGTPEFQRTVDLRPIRRREDRPKEEQHDPKVKAMLTGLIKGME